MLNEVRELIDRLTELIQNTDNAKEILTGIAEELSRVLRASVVLVDEAGKVIISKPRESDFSLNIRRKLYRFSAERPDKKHRGNQIRY